MTHFDTFVRIIDHINLKLDYLGLVHARLGLWVNMDYNCRDFELTCVVSRYHRRSTCTRLTTRCRTWRPSWTRSSATLSGTSTTPAELRWDFRNILRVGMFLARDEVNLVVHFVILFSVILWLWSCRVGVGVRDLKAWRVSWAHQDLYISF